MPPAVLKEVEEEIAKIPKAAKVNIKEPLQFYRGRSCPHCNNGYAGRIGIFEVLEMTNILAEITLKEPSETQLGGEAKRQGMITMKQDGILKVLQGETSLEEVMRMAEEK